MAEIMAVPDNGLRYASTFAGGGGSSLGYRWAGYRCVWANEFVEAARASYAANFPDVPLDGRDIRLVRGEEILERAGLGRGELDLLDGSPPCQPFSTAGKRQKKWGIETQYSDDNRQRADDLFFQYVRLVDELRPRAFVAENVSGLVKGVSKGYFKEVMAALSALGYRVEARMLDAQWLGVPQTRQRVIIAGVREDLRLPPSFPAPEGGAPYTVRDALPWVAAAAHKPGAHPNYTRGEVTDRPAPTVTTGADLYALPAFPEPDPNRYTLGDACPWLDQSHWFSSGQFADKTHLIDKPVPCIQASPISSYHLQALALGPGHPDGVDEGDREVKGLSPLMVKKWEGLAVGARHPKHFQLHRVATEQAVPCVSASSAIGGWGFSQPLPPHVPRRFTILEVKRICGFPDDYRLVGTYEERWARLGNAVVPPMARAMGEALAPILLAARAAT